MAVSLAGRISLIIADAIVLGVTWMKTARTTRQARRMKIRVPLNEVLLRDGEPLSPPSSGVKEYPDECRNQARSFLREW